MNPVKRFSNRVANYVKYRPGYPAELLKFLKLNRVLTAESVVADIGSGTGISARVFLENGNVVYGVEPNDAMRNAAEQFLKGFPNFISVNGTSQATGLGSGSVDFIIAAQAFHWFEPEATRAEFVRILKPGGYVALIWNERQVDSTEFLREYEKILVKFGSDYQTVRHENIDDAKLSAFFQTDFRHAAFANVQELDLEGLKGRVASSSYMPAEGGDGYEPMIKELESLFAKYEEGGKIKVFYDTNIYYSQL